ncbi:MAG TPA: hypothetical protein ENI89_05710 [Desulfobulbus sp.]|nr:hypothetical protein [Desulfobulbus sp.]
MADDHAAQCLSMEQAAGILGVAPAELLRGSEEVPVSPEKRRNHTYRIPPRHCWIRAAENFAKSISYTVYHYNDPLQARAAWGTMRENFATVARIVAVAIPDGEAFRVDDSRFRRTVARRQGLLLDISRPADAALQRRIMFLVLKNP